MQRADGGVSPARPQMQERPGADRSPRGRLDRVRSGRWWLDRTATQDGAATDYNGQDDGDDRDNGHRDDDNHDNEDLRARRGRTAPYGASPATQVFACSSSLSGNTRASPGIIHANSRVARAIQSMSVTIADRTHAS
jgi:hypothetical protein